jgi:Carbohydrate esterase, sialic acid-specific acetylesterase
MKKVLIGLVLIINAFIVNAQSPAFSIPQNIGGKNTQVHVPGLLVFDSGMVLKSYTDTNAANLAKVKFKNSVVVVDSILYLYNGLKWVKQYNVATSNNNVYTGFNGVTVNGTIISGDSLNIWTKLNRKDTLYVLVTGQSNSFGSANNVLTGLDTLFNTNIQAWDTITNSYKTLIIGQRPHTIFTSNFSTSAQFWWAKKYVKEHPNTVIRFVLLAVGGAPASEWHTGTTRGIRLNRILQIFSQANIKKIDYVFVDQGEADSDIASQNVHSAKWDSTKYIIRDYFKNQALPFFFVGMPRQYYGAVGLNGKSSIDEVLQSKDINNDPNDRYVDTDSATLVFAGGPGGSIHFDNYGLKYIGEQLYNASKNAPLYSSTQYGNVGSFGIGTYRPKAKLHVSDTTNNPQAIFEGSENTTGVNIKSSNVGKIRIGNAPFSSGEIQYDGTDFFIDNTNTSPASGLKFRTKTGSASPLTTMYITGGGNVGIGTLNVNYRMVAVDPVTHQGQFYGYASGSGGSGINGSILLGQDRQLGAKIEQDNGNLNFLNENYFNTAKFQFKLHTSGTISNASQSLPKIPLTITTDGIDIIGKTTTTNIQITNGAGLNKVLTSDAAGNGIWQTASGGSTYTSSNGITKSINDFKLGGNLTTPTSIITTATNTLSITGLETGSAASDSVMVVSSPNSQLKVISVTDLLDVVTYTNGINNSNPSGAVKLGGGLTEPTTLTTDITNVLKIAGLQTFANEAAAVSAGLTSGTLYKKADGTLMVKL